MSAFFVGLPHINAMVTMAPRDFNWARYVGTREHGDGQDRAVRMLVRENVNSLMARYPKDYDELVGVKADEIDGWIDGLKWKPDRWFEMQPNAIVATFKAIDCYEYQSCEHDGWEASKAREFCDGLRKRLIHKVPGYDEAETWEYHGPPKEARVRVFALTDLMDGRA